MRRLLPAARPWVLSVVIFLLTFLLAGCSTAKSELRRARGLELSGRYNDAVVLYRDLLDRLPAGQVKLRAMLNLRVGECLWQSGHLSEAAHNFEQAVQLDDGILPAHLRLAEIYVVAGAPEPALQQAEFVLARDPHNIDAIIAAGAAYGALGQKDLAREYLERAFERDPARDNIAITLANLYFDENGAAKARAVLERNAGANPRSPAPWLALGRIEEQEGNNPGAEEAYRHAVAVDNSPATNLRLAQFLQRSARVPEAEQVLRRVDSQRPALPTAVADFNLFSGHVAKAEVSYLTALAQPPAPQAKMAAERAAIAARLVEADLQRASRDPGAIAAAAGHLNSFHASMDGATVAVLQAEIALARNDLAAAVAAGQHAVDLADDSAPAHYVLGIAKLRSGDAANALLQWNDALDRNPDFAPAHFVLADQAFRAGALDLAEEHVASVVREEPGDYAALALYAQVLSAQKRYPEAVAMAQRALAMQHDAPEPHILLGDLALQRRNAGEALLQFEQAILLDPHSQAAMDGLMRTYRTGTVTRPALARMERTARSKPPSPALLEITGRLYADHGWYADAVRCLREALEIDAARSSARIELVRLLLAHGDSAAAFAVAEQAKGPEALLLAGLREQQQQDRPAAIRDYEAALAQDSTGIAANNLAWLYAQQGSQLDRALQLAHAANDRQPNNPAVLDTIGYVHLQRREYTDAINFLRQAISMAAARTAAVVPSPAEVAAFHRHLAEAYLKAGQPDQAAAEIARANPADAALNRASQPSAR